MQRSGIRRGLGLLLLAVIAIAGGGACTSTSDQSAEAPQLATAGGAGRGDVPDVAVGSPAAPGTVPDQQQQQQITQPGVDRKLIRTATLELVAPDVVDVTTRARQVAVDLGGFAGREEARSDSATLTLHVPSDQFDVALSRISGLVPDGVRSRTQTAEDVTEQLVDVESRIATQRASVERVRALLGRAQTTGEIVQIESEVTKREADLESLQKRRETLAGRVALSEITVRVGHAATPEPAEEAGSGFLGGLVDGWDAFLVAGGWLLRVLGALLPFLIGLGIPGFLVWRWAAVRRRARTAP